MTDFIFTKRHKKRMHLTIYLLIILGAGAWLTAIAAMFNTAQIAHTQKAQAAQINFLHGKNYELIERNAQLEIRLEQIATGQTNAE